MKLEIKDQQTLFAVLAIGLKPTMPHGAKIGINPETREIAIIDPVTNDFRTTTDIYNALWLFYMELSSSSSFVPFTLDEDELRILGNTKPEFLCRVWDDHTVEEKEGVVDIIVGTTTENYLGSTLPTKRFVAKNGTIWQYAEPVNTDLLTRLVLWPALTSFNDL